MSARRIHWIGHLLIAAVALPAFGCDTAWIDPMERQKKYKAYELNPLFPDERAMRPLVDGTISREQVIAPAVLRTGLSAPNTYAPRIPVQVTRELLTLGRSRFQITCAACHGLAGDGQSVVATKMALRPPPSLVAPPIADYPAGRVFQIISLGYGLMNSYADVLSPEERWAIVAYWGALKISAGAPLEAAPPEVRQRLMQEQP